MTSCSPTPATFSSSAQRSRLFGRLIWLHIRPKNRRALGWLRQLAEPSPASIPTRRRTPWFGVPHGALSAPGPGPARAIPAEPPPRPDAGAVVEGVAAIECGERHSWLRLDDEWVAQRGAALEQGDGGGAQSHRALRMSGASFVWATFLVRRSSCGRSPDCDAQSDARHRNRRPARPVRCRDTNRPAWWKRRVLAP